MKNQYQDPRSRQAYAFTAAWLHYLNLDPRGDMAYYWDAYQKAEATIHDQATKDKRYQKAKAAILTGAEADTITAEALQWAGRNQARHHHLHDRILFLRSTRLMGHLQGVAKRHGIWADVPANVQEEDADFYDQEAIA